MNTRKLEGIDAKVITRSVYRGHELITFEIQLPKAYDAEFEKHRNISSNSSSDRAIPFETMVSKPYFIPTDVRLNEKGMQGYSELPKEDLGDLQWDLFELRENTIKVLRLYPEVHKQTLNRYLMPWSYQSKIATMNNKWFRDFLRLRSAPDADPVMQTLAAKMSEAYAWSERDVQLLKEGDWHLPYITEEELKQYSTEDLLKASCARCARVSYDNHDGSAANVDADIKLYHWLVEHYHLTPLENCATPMTPNGGWEK